MEACKETAGDPLTSIGLRPEYIIETTAQYQ
jgi:hypothetical protein